MFGGNRVHPAPPDSGPNPAVQPGPDGAGVPGGGAEGAAVSAWAPPVGAERMEAGGELYIPFTVAKAKVSLCLISLFNLTNLD